jgi:hypothetical protein
MIRNEYTYHVFLSYRRYGQWPGWVHDHFLPLFHHYLGEELGEEPRIFFDRTDIDAGTAWPWKLATGLAGSRVLVCLWSRQYFGSKWCKAELGHMRARENVCGFSTLERPQGLIVPAIIHDGDDLPPIERVTEPLRLIDVVNVRMAEGSKTAEALARQIAAWAPTVARAVRHAPDFDPQWEKLAAAAIGDLFQPQPAQLSVPSLGAV